MKKRYYIFVIVNSQLVKIERQSEDGYISEEKALGALEKFKDKEEGRFFKKSKYFENNFEFLIYPTYI